MAIRGDIEYAKSKFREPAMESIATQHPFWPRVAESAEWTAVRVESDAGCGDPTPAHSDIKPKGNCKRKAEEGDTTMPESRETVAEGSPRGETGSGTPGGGDEKVNRPKAGQPVVAGDGDQGPERHKSEAQETQVVDRGSEESRVEASRESRPEFKGPVARERVADDAGGVAGQQADSPRASTQGDG